MLFVQHLAPDLFDVVVEIRAGSDMTLDTDAIWIGGVQADLQAAGFQCKLAVFIVVANTHGEHVIGRNGL